MGKKTGRIAFNSVRVIFQVTVLLTVWLKRNTKVLVPISIFEIKIHTGVYYLI